MKLNLKYVGAVTSALILFAGTASMAFAGPGGPFGSVESILHDIQNSLTYIGHTTDATQAEVTDPGHGLAAINSGVQAIQSELQGSGGGSGSGSGSVRLSSGPFDVPDETSGAVDWDVVNESDQTQTVSVTVYQLMIGGAKQPVAPGTITLTLAPGESSHNANNIAYSGPFMPGVYYEVIVEASSPDVLPAVDIWQTQGGDSVIPGTTIPSGSWARLQ